MLYRGSLGVTMADDEEWYYRGRGKRQNNVTSVAGADGVLESVE